MRSLAVLIILAAFLYVTSAVTYSPAAFLEFPGLPVCARVCRVILYTTNICAPPNVPVSNNATSIRCFCQSENLRSLYNIREMCNVHCDDKAMRKIENAYSSFCGLSQISVTSSAIPAPTRVLPPSTSSSVALTTCRSSTSILQPTQTSPPGAEELQVEHTSSQTWIQKSWKYVLTGILVLVIVLAIAVYALLRFIHYRRRQRPLSEAERYAELERALQEHLEESYGPRARGQIVPLKTMSPDNSIQGRLSRLPLGRMSRSKTPTNNPIISRRQRPQTHSVSAPTHLSRDLPPTAHEMWTPQRPASFRTTTSSIGQRSLSSPLVPVSPDLFRNIPYAQSFRYYAEEQAERERDLDIIRSISSGQCGTMTASFLLWRLPRGEKGGLLFGCYILAGFGGGYAVLVGLQIANTAGNVLGPFLFKPEDAPAYGPGFVPVLATAVAAAALATVYRYVCIWENRRRDKSGTMEGFDNGYNGDLTDINPRFRYLHAVAQYAFTFNVNSRKDL
ncbi:transmembrane transport [Ascochyta rabiei]|uniref:Transmembrane transport n=1 Tax=Didymella rabiei TaxID=5454 RepID=A0A163B9T5_DIDRA|nr:transmembrane transport [Ascochyta rabiei]